MAYQDYANDLRNIADQIEGLEESYDNLSAEAQEIQDELEKAEDKIVQLEMYIEWAQTFYPDMEGQYKAICDVRG